MADDPVEARLARVRERIADAARQAGRSPDEVTLVGVSKTFPAERVVEAVRAGLRHVGENRVQEAEDKVRAVTHLLGDAAPPCWHMVGHLQSNKARRALDLFQVVESVDSVRLAEALSRRVAAAGRGSLEVLLEVYVGDDPARPGLRPADLEAAADAIVALPGLSIQGLMTVAPLGWDTAATRQAFRAVRCLRDDLARRHPRVHWRQLSMGMSDDFTLAIEEGSTAVRIGRALFGERPAPLTGPTDAA